MTLSAELRRDGSRGRASRGFGAARLSHALSVVGVFAVGIILAGWGARELDSMRFPYLFVVAAYATVVLTHEFGHALAGLLWNFRVAFLYMGPLRVEWRRDGYVQIGLNSRLSLWGGAVVVLPRAHPDGEDFEPFRRSMIALFGAGPAMSVVAGAVVLVLTLVHPSIQAGSLGGSLSWLQLLGLMSLVVGLGQVIPIRIGDQLSDGLRVLRLMRGRPGTDNALLDAMIVANADGVRPRDWPIPETRTFEDLTDLPTLVLIYYALLDRGRPEEAWRVINLPSEYRKGKSERTWRVVRDLERAYLRTVHFGDDGSELPTADIATRYPRVSTLSLVRARVTRMVADGDLQEALHCADAVRHWRAVPYTSGLTQFNLSEIDNLLATAVGQPVPTELTA